MATEPNITSENEYIGLSPLTLDDVRNFCNAYIKPFAPYREEKVYDTIINNLTEYYYNQTYFNIPSELQKIFAEADFDTPSVYNNLLIAVGVPSDIIDNISLSDKMIFLRTLSDFERYKGTISFCQKVGEAFSDRLSIYELFIDLEGSNWVFKPVKVYLHDDLELKLTSIPYATVQSAVPSLLLSEEQLTTLYADEKLILPIKSNLLLLDNDMMADVSILYDVIVTIFLNTYKEDYINLYFRDDSKLIQLKTFYFLWYYLLTEYNGIPWTAFATRELLRFTYSDIEFPTFIGSIPTTIDNLSQIIDRYDNIKIINSTTRDYDNSRNDFDEFHKDVSSAFYTNADSHATTSTDMFNELMLTNSILISYIDDRITNSTIGKQAEINLILTEMYSSLLLYSSTYTGDTYFTQYVDYFLRYLPQVLVNPENTTSHRILYNLKPYHVELYSTANTGVRCQDKFNQIFIDDEKGLNFLSDLLRASVLSFADKYIFNIDHYNYDTDIDLLDILEPFDMITNMSDDSIASDLCNNLDFEKLLASAMTVSESYVITKT